jgi:predicted KAP-like P-loop ATPase
MEDIALLSADRPSTDPAHDLFGHAPFARTLAKAICNYSQSDGIVLALYGPWGSGKSTVLAYVQHELEHGVAKDAPIVVSFNPWWFSGQENLAKAFLGQLQVVLPQKYEKFRVIGDKMAEFSEALGGAGDAVGLVTGQGWIGKVVRFGAKLLGRKTKDVPALKQQLSDLLLQKRKRVLVIVDDIDRLAPAEVQQLFTVIKALADFPYVTYLLAFDREVASAAISKQTQLPGDRYLEKIIQVPFELPRPDRESLRRALFNRLDAAITPVPDGRFDQMYWTNVYYSGIDPLISVPRDVVRLSNAVSVTYPAVAGEVNPVDFIAIEALRVFVPAAYDAIRTSPEQFTTLGRIAGLDSTTAKKHAIKYHDGWLKCVPKMHRSHVKELVKRIFPALESVWANNHYGSESSVRWRRELRICAPEILPAYFKLSLAESAVSRAELDSLLTVTSSPVAFAALIEKAATIRSAGGSKLLALLDRFMDHVEQGVDPSDTGSIIEALLGIGDRYLTPEHTSADMFGAGVEMRIARIAYHLLKRLDVSDRTGVLLPAIRGTSSPRCSQYLIALLSEEVDKQAQGGDTALLQDEQVQEMKAAWCLRIGELAEGRGLSCNPKVGWIVRDWREWGDPEQAIAWWRSVAASDEGLIRLIASEAVVSRSQTASDLGWKTRLRVDPRSLEPYGDVMLMADRVRLALKGKNVSEERGEAVQAFLSAVERMEAGKSLDAFDYFDD